MWREHPASSQWTDATGGEGLERSFWKEVKAKHWSELEHRIASNYIAVAPDGGRFDKAAALPICSSCNWTTTPWATSRAK